VVQGIQIPSDAFCLLALDAAIIPFYITLSPYTIIPHFTSFLSRTVRIVGAVPVVAVGLPVAVVVLVVLAILLGARINGIVPVVTIVAAGSGIVLVTVSIDPAGVVLAVDSLVTVIVFAVIADLRSAWIDTVVVVIAVLPAGGGIVAVAVFVCQAVTVGTVRISITVVVFTVSAFFRCPGIDVVVRVIAISTAGFSVEAVTVVINQTVIIIAVCEIIAIIIHPVGAEFRSAGIDTVIPVITVISTGGCIVAVAVPVDETVGIIAVGLTVAVIVLSIIADFCCPGMHCGVPVIAIVTTGPGVIAVTVDVKQTVVIVAVRFAVMVVIRPVVATQLEILAPVVRIAVFGGAGIVVVAVHRCPLADSVDALAVVSTGISIETARAVFQGFMNAANEV